MTVGWNGGIFKKVSEIRLDQVKFSPQETDLKTSLATWNTFIIDSQFVYLHFHLLLQSFLPRNACAWSTTIKVFACLRSFIVPLTKYYFRGFLTLPRIKFLLRLFLNIYCMKMVYFKNSFFGGAGIGKDLTIRYAPWCMGHNTIISWYIVIFHIVLWKCQNRA